MRLWTCLILLFLLFGRDLCENNETFESKYSDVRICTFESTKPIRTTQPRHAYAVLRNMFRDGCTHIEGNLLLNQLTALPGHADALKPLSKVREISGFLSVTNSKDIHIDFRSLTVIRGKVLHNVKYALNIEGNSNSSIDLRNLKVIKNGHVALHYNSNEGYLTDRVDFKAIFEIPEDQIVEKRRNALTNNFKNPCHKNCAVGSDSKQHCWGPSIDQCQINYKCSGISCSSQWCTKVNTCCKEACIGGCSSTGEKKCFACKDYLDGDKCVHNCKSKVRQTGYGRSTVHTKTNYKVGIFCTESCPAFPKQFLKQLTTCVLICDQKHQFFEKGLQCTKSEKPWRKTCNEEDINKRLYIDKGKNINRFMTKEFLNELENCTHFTGRIKIKKKSFTNYGVTEKLLEEKMRNIVFIQGDLTINIEKKLKSLSFLSNLVHFTAISYDERISGIKLIMTNIQYLGLKNLRRMKNGEFIFLGNPKLSCSTETLKKFPIKWKRFNKPCNDEFSCDLECKDGCWGPGPNLCFNCKNNIFNDTCVANCSHIPGFYSNPNYLRDGWLPVNYSGWADGGRPMHSFIKDSQFQRESVKAGIQCMPCHPECRQTCSGPSNTQCKGGCKNVQIDGKCVKTCGSDRYREKNTNLCKKCHENCRNECSGKSNAYSKLFGCHSCTTYQFVGTGANASLICAPEDCSAGTFKELVTTSNPNLKKYTFDSKEVQLCLPCTKFCARCTKDRCIDCNGVFFEKKCIEKCPQSETFGQRPSGNATECLECSKLCSKGCKNSTEFDCNECRYKKMYLDDEMTVRKCLPDSDCPRDSPHQTLDKVTGERICLNQVQHEAHKKLLNNDSLLDRNKIIIIAICCLAVIIILALIIFCVIKRRSSLQVQLKIKFTAVMANIHGTDSKFNKNLNEKPDMNRLIHILKTDIDYDRKRSLGNGAFGTVYKGRLYNRDQNIWIDVALKMIHDNDINAILDEVKVMASVTNKYCLPFFGLYQDAKPCLVSAFMPHGSLDKFLAKNRLQIKAGHILTWCEQIANGMAYLEFRSIIHRDLATRNVLVYSIDHVLITDFGLSKILDVVDSESNNIVVRSGKVPIRWLALETLEYNIYSHKTDVWSFGVTLWEIFTFGERPYKNLQTTEIKDYVRNGGRLCQPDICTLEVYMVMVKCWMEDEKCRPNFQELMDNFIKFNERPNRYLWMMEGEDIVESPQTQEAISMFGMNQINTKTSSNEEQESATMLINSATASNAKNNAKNMDHLQNKNLPRTDMTCEAAVILEKNFGRQENPLYKKSISVIDRNMSNGNPPQISFSANNSNKHDRNNTIFFSNTNESELDIPILDSKPTTFWERLRNRRDEKFSKLSECSSAMSPDSNTCPLTSATSVDEPHRKYTRNDLINTASTSPKPSWIDDSHSNVINKVHHQSGGQISMRRNEDETNNANLSTEDDNFELSMPDNNEHLEEDYLEPKEKCLLHDQSPDSGAEDNNKRLDNSLTSSSRQRSGSSGMSDGYYNLTPSPGALISNDLQKHHSQNSDKNHQEQLTESDNKNVNCKFLSPEYLEPKHFS